MRLKDAQGGVEQRALKMGGYSIAGLDDVCIVEQSDLSDLLRSFTVDPKVGVDRLRASIAAQQVLP